MVETESETFGLKMFQKLDDMEFNYDEEGSTWVVEKCRIAEQDGRIEGVSFMPAGSFDNHQDALYAAAQFMAQFGVMASGLYENGDALADEADRKANFFRVVELRKEDLE